MWGADRKLDLLNSLSYTAIKIRERIKNAGQAYLKPDGKHIVIASAGQSKKKKLRNISKHFNVVYEQIERFLIIIFHLDVEDKEILCELLDKYHIYYETILPLKKSRKKLKKKSRHVTAMLYTSHGAEIILNTKKGVLETWIIEKDTEANMTKTLKQVVRNAATTPYKKGLITKSNFECLGKFNNKVFIFYTDADLSRGHTDLYLLMVFDDGNFIARGDTGQFRINKKIVKLLQDFVKKKNYKKMSALMHPYENQLESI